MKTVTCDICGTDAGVQHWMFEREAFLHKASDLVRPFTYKLEVTCFKFNTTNFDVCDACLLAAIRQSFNYESKKEGVSSA